MVVAVLLVGFFQTWALVDIFNALQRIAKALENKEQAKP